LWIDIDKHGLSTQPPDGARRREERKQQNTSSPSPMSSIRPKQCIAA
jgi:hypothetical protein